MSDVGDYLSVRPPRRTACTICRASQPWIRPYLISKLHPDYDHKPTHSQRNLVTADSSMIASQPPASVPPHCEFPTNATYTRNKRPPPAGLIVIANRPASNATPHCGFGTTPRRTRNKQPFPLRIQHSASTNPQQAALFPAGSERTKHTPAANTPPLSEPACV